MAILNSVSNLPGAHGLVGGVLNALPGYSTLGQNISNPGVNYQGNPNPTAYPSGNIATWGAGAQGGGQVQSDSTTTPSGGGAAVDPYAALRASFASQKSNVYGAANDAAANAGIGLNQSILDQIHSLTLGQQGIDQQGVQANLAKQQGLQGIQGMVSRGIQSGGVTLANKNATDSSAAEAIARAYGVIGRNQASSVGNQFAQAQNDIGVKQKEQDYQIGQAPSKVHDTITQTVNGIVANAQQQFAYLDAQMANASLPDRIAIEQEKENVRQQALSHLQGFDSQIQQGVGGIHAATPDQNRIAANTLATAGTAATDPYTFTSQIPAQYQGTGPFASELPIFTFPTKQRQLA